MLWIELYLILLDLPYSTILYSLCISPHGSNHYKMFYYFFVYRSLPSYTILYINILYLSFLQTTTLHYTLHQILLSSPFETYQPSLNPSQPTFFIPTLIYYYYYYYDTFRSPYCYLPYYYTTYTTYYLLYNYWTLLSLDTFTCF